MPEAWRIVKERHLATALDGEGARIFGARWNSPGIPVVYASGTRALATLEVLAGLGTNSVLPAYVLIPLAFADSMVITIDLADLPKGWNRSPPGAATQRIGDAWVASGESVVLEVPSVLVPQESNFLLNPSHPKFPAVTLGDPEGLSFDPRLLK